ncbi:hypothetical protein PVAP13_3NG132400 [Panicum virgatum]|uniref:Uncharacterized protein n=1 Tax=Panicum virgatum TaxID=38727 RepID=A0A8T0UAC1_PANVG|nr:hypothetical protein PVAP13_3NG132400 [Panicum virgatum]
MRRAEERVALAWRRASLADRGVEAGQGVRALGGLPCVYKYSCILVLGVELEKPIYRPSEEWNKRSQHTDRSAAGAFVAISRVPVIIRRSSVPILRPASLSN